MSAILMALLYVAIFSLVAWAVVALVPAPNPTVATIKNVVVGIAGILFVFWLLGHFGLVGPGGSLPAPTGHPVR